MRLFFNVVHMDGIVVIGEGEKDQAPMLYNGERLGTGNPPVVDVAVDPIDGTRLVARGEANALSVVAVAERGAMFNPGPVRLHGKDRHRPRGRQRRSTSRRRSRRTSRSSPWPSGWRSAR